MEPDKPDKIDALRQAGYVKLRFLFGDLKINECLTVQV